MIPSTKRVVAVVGATAALATLGAATSTNADAATIPSVLTKIRYCESGNNYASKASSGTAGGAYGFLDSTWRSSSVAATKSYAHAWLAPAAVQDAAAIALYNQLGTKPWDASKSCWSKLTSAPTTSSTTNTGSSTSATSKTSTTSKTVNRTLPKPTGTPPKGAPHGKPPAGAPKGAPPKGTPPKGTPPNCDGHGRPPAGTPKGAPGKGAPHGKPPVKSS